ncbi:acyltransferase [Methanococcoides sp. NM1]|uniref:acyltransferase n=1 Tax=Methanococcoides sp. NM1 TaxID=1201013 RepID=UPI001083BE85|nr:acyltransferase [Methanococcoides sp. NM1]
MNKEYLYEMNYLRGLAIIGIIAIHSLNERDSNNELIALLNINLEQVSTYSIPVFLFISGLVLTYNYSNKELHYIEFIKKRLNVIFIPYVLWSCIYMAYRIILDQDSISLLMAVKKIIVGSAFFHLYYIILIMQFYLLFPLILDLVQKTRKHHHELLIITFLFNLVVISLYYYQLDFIDERIIRKVFIVWIFYFIMGSVIGSKLDQHRHLLSNISMKHLGALLFVALSYLLYSYYADGLFMEQTNIFWLRPQVLLYASLCIVALFKIVNEIDKKYLSGWPARLLNEMGRDSFGIYLSHMLIIELLLRALPGSTLTSSYFLYEYIIFFMGVALSILFIKLINKLPMGHILIGSPR